MDTLTLSVLFAYDALDLVILREKVKRGAEKWQFIGMATILSLHEHVARYGGHWSN